MPPKGFKVITVTEELYADIRAFFEDAKNSLKQQGVRSLPAWITTELYSSIREHNVREARKAQSPPLRILIVDDDVEICKTLETLLRKAGYKPDSVNTSQDAIRKCEGVPYDAVFVDIRLPDIDGVELLATLGKKNPLMVKIIVTGFPSLPNATDALNKGADAYIVKPFDPENLLITLKQKLLQRSERYRTIQRVVVDHLHENLRAL